MASSSNQKSPCPICGKPKTAWSEKCGTCEGNRQRYLAAIRRVESDRQLLASLHGRTLQAVADDLNVSRQRVYQLKQAAQRRAEFLAMHPLPTQHQPTAA